MIVDVPASPNESDNPLTLATAVLLEVIVHAPLEGEVGGIIVRLGSPTT